MTLEDEIYNLYLEYDIELFSPINDWSYRLAVVDQSNSKLTKYVQRVNILIQERLAEALISPSPYVREFARLVIKENSK